jgi:hypothetical protein
MDKVMGFLGGITAKLSRNGLMAKRSFELK